MLDIPDISTKRVYVIPVTPMGYNHAYPTSPFHGRRFLTPAGKRFKQFVHWTMEEYDANVYGSKFEAEYVQFELYCLFRPVTGMKSDGLRFDNGNLKRKDTSGFIKLVEDAAAEYLEIDDKFNLRVICEKRQADFDLGVNVMILVISPLSQLEINLDQWLQMLPIRTSP